MKSLKIIGIAINIIGAMAVLGLMISASSAIVTISDLLITIGFYIWVILPFLVLIVLTAVIHRKGHSGASRAAILLTSILVVVSSVVIYWASIFNSESSTSALVFVVLPIYAMVATAVVYVLAWLLLRLVIPK
ncbi:MAG: hypothetical protein ACXWID_10500 [Pyrinomonadaceae bacterium]